MATQIFGRLSPKTLNSLTSFRSLSTRATVLSLVERGSSALKLRNGYDYYRTTVFMQNCYDSRCPPTRVEMIHDYVKKLSGLVGSEEEARMMVYSAGSGLSAYNAFGTLLSDELYHRVEGLPGVYGIYRKKNMVNSKNMDELMLSPVDLLEENLSEQLVREECEGRGVLENLTIPN